MIQKSFDVDGSPDIEVRIESGRVEFHRGQEGKVNVTVDTKASDFIVEQRGNSILVSSDKTTSWLSRGSAYVVIETPEMSDVRVGVASAAITADVPLGKVDLKSASGDIEVESAESLAIKSASGDADIRSVEHSLSFTSASGDLRVREACRGNVAVSTASGDINIEACEGSITANTASGDIRIARFTGRSGSFKGMSGEVTLGIPPRTEIELDASLLSGRLRAPQPDTSDEEPERRMSIRAKLVSGDLRFERVPG